MRVFSSRTVKFEAIDELNVAVSFDKITQMPQYGLILHLFTSKALTGQEGGNALDIGCGGGRLVMKLARSYPFSEVVGLDLSDEMLKLARQRAAGVGLGEHVKFSKGNAERIPYPNNSFDLVVSTVSLHHWSRPKTVFDEIARVLTPGGKCAVADMRRDAVPPFIGFLWFVQHFIVPPSLGKVGEPLGSIKSAYTPEEASELLSGSELGAFCQVSAGPFWLIIKGRKPKR
jgi:ubiquinone/menaquinone biosynthesis C-methylase UbiE